MILFTTNMFQRCSSTRQVETKNQIQLRYICSMYMLQIVICHQLRDSGIAIHWASAWRGKFCQLSHFFGFCVLAAARQLDAKSLDEVHQVFCQLDTEQNAGKMLGNIIGVRPIERKISGWGMGYMTNIDQQAHGTIATPVLGYLMDDTPLFSDPYGRPTDLMRLDRLDSSREKRTRDQDNSTMFIDFLFSFFPGLAVDGGLKVALNWWYRRDPHCHFRSPKDSDGDGVLTIQEVSWQANFTVFVWKHEPVCCESRVHSLQHLWADEETSVKALNSPLRAVWFDTRTFCNLFVTWLVHHTSRMSFRLMVSSFSLVVSSHVQKCSREIWSINSWCSLLIWRNLSWNSHQFPMFQCNVPKKKVHRGFTDLGGAEMDDLQVACEKKWDIARYTCIIYHKDI